jgi:hypothetical protein
MSATISELHVKLAKEMQSERAYHLRATLTSYYATHAPAELDERHADDRTRIVKVENLVARVVGGPPSNVGGLVLGGVLWTEAELYAKVAAKYGVAVEALTPLDDGFVTGALLELVDALCHSSVCVVANAVDVVQLACYRLDSPAQSASKSTATSALKGAYAVLAQLTSSGGDDDDSDGYPYSGDNDVAAAMARPNWHVFEAALATVLASE